MGAVVLQVTLSAKHSAPAQQYAVHRHAHRQETALMMEAVIFRTRISCFLLIPSCFLSIPFFPGQQLTTRLKNIAFPNDCMAVSKGCPTSGVKFEFTFTPLGRENGVLQQRGLKNTKSEAQFQVGYIQLSMPFLPTGSSRYLEKQKQQNKG